MRTCKLVAAIMAPCARQQKAQEQEANGAAGTQPYKTLSRRTRRREQVQRQRQRGQRAQPQRERGEAHVHARGVAPWRPMRD